jgi:hypothetical protein
MRPSVGCFIIAIQLAGCASAQVNYNTLDLASTVDGLVTKQVLDNLSKIIDNPLAIPAQVDIAAGSATTINSITPSLSDPYTKAVTTTSTFASAVAAATTNTTTNTTTRASSPQSASLGVSDSWQQNWTIAPITGSGALYRYQFSGDKNELKTEYPLIKQTRTATVKLPAGAVSGRMRAMRTCDPAR